MWIQRESLGYMLHTGDSESNPELFPPEILDALRDRENDPKRFYHDREFRFNGWIIQRGIVGIRSDAPQAAKDEWMSYWKMMHDNPGLDA